LRFDLSVIGCDWFRPFCKSKPLGFWQTLSLNEHLFNCNSTSTLKLDRIILGWETPYLISKSTFLGTWVQVCSFNSFLISLWKLIKILLPVSKPTFGIFCNQFKIKLLNLRFQNSIQSRDGIESFEGFYQPGEIWSQSCKFCLLLLLTWQPLNGLESFEGFLTARRDSKSNLQTFLSFVVIDITTTCTLGVIFALKIWGFWQKYLNPNCIHTLKFFWKSILISIFANFSFNCNSICFELKQKLSSSWENLTNEMHYNLFVKA